MDYNKSAVKEQDLEKQIGGCMAGFFNIFDRTHLISRKCLSPSPSPESNSASERSSPVKSKNSGRYQKPLSSYSTPELRSPASDSDSLTRSPLALPAVMEDFKLQGGSSTRSSSPWRFSKEAPRLSLDSRAFVDAKGSLKPRQIRPEAESEVERGSPSVIARLMGLEPLPQQPLQRSASESRVTRDYRFIDSFNSAVDKGPENPAIIRTGRAQPARKSFQKSFFDSADFFPEPKHCGIIHVDRVSKISGFEAPPTDLETLKQLLEALKLKGLLHPSNKHQTRIGGNGNMNLVLDNGMNESPIKPARPPSGIRSRPSTRAGVSPPASPRRDQCSKGSVKSPPPSRRRPTLMGQRPQPVETGFKDDKRSNKGSRSNTMKCYQAEEEVDDYNRRGKTLLERCDKLLHSIAEMEAAETGGDSQPSPVSVLDASLYHEDSSPSPVMKRSLDFAAESEDESWGVSISSSPDSEYVYISDILRASHYLPQDSDIFSLLEKQQYLKGKWTSRAAAQERRLIFDAVQEIVGRRRRLPPWRVEEEADKMQVIWSEYQKIRKKKSLTEEEDLAGYVCGVLGRDLSEDRWPDCQVEISEAVLDIERLVFKDIIGETIRHLVTLNRSDSLRRRLLF